ncbi:hypothetical protein [Atopomonas hussainii]|uniref:hypothetical protein n=1 Tax=Atopomonas hussainii TaxID=1429083 RepID=UPI0008FFE98B|nr:hypothetical protein [Atopomonas hussainii]
MTRWLLLALGCVSGGVAAAWLLFSAPPATLNQPVAGVATQPASATPAKPELAKPASDAFSVSPAPERPVEQEANEPTLSPAEAITLMQVMAEQGDPRSPALLKTTPRRLPTAEQLADGEQYSAYEQEQLNDLLRSYTGIVNDIPEIKERIDQAEQLGERTPDEISEARAAVGQLEAMQTRLQQENPALLPQ